MLFDGWYDLVRILVVGVCAYAGLVILLRLTGKRTLSKMNAFDLIVTVALGSTLASALLTSDVSLSEGLLAFAVLCLLQYALTFASVRWPRFEKLVKAEPTLLFFRGRHLDAALRRQRVTREEVMAAIRASGASTPDSVDAVVLETDGSFSVVAAADAGGIETLHHVEGAPPQENARDGNGNPISASTKA